MEVEAADSVVTIRSTFPGTDGEAMEEIMVATTAEDSAARDIAGVVLVVEDGERNRLWGTRFDEFATCEYKNVGFVTSINFSDVVVVAASADATVSIVVLQIFLVSRHTLHPS